ncbi:MAG: tetratricopeptide repeat protein [Planctomycetaceae bacterium]|jgi:tetratricopeptide (TPR) repeat protein|nr:tetratricopeptide repeat protein [Planctomycetaceae bacterium]
MSRYLLAFCSIFALTVSVYAQKQPAAPAQKPNNTIPAAAPNKIVDVGTEEPKITPIPDGLFFEWSSYNNIGSIEVDKSVTGDFQIMFDVPISVIGKPAEPVSSSEMIVPLADYWIVRGKPERAIPLYRKGLAAQPNSLLFQNNLAMLLSSAQGKHAEALDIINKALEGNHDEVRLLDSKGLILMNNGKASEAVPILERSVQLSCQLPIYCMHLATALDMDGRESGARRYFTQARSQLETQAPNMAADDKVMFDKLKLKYPNSAGADTPAL